MPNIEGSRKQQNKEKVWLWVKRHPNGILRSELESLTGIQTRTLDNYLNELEYEGKITKDGMLWFPLNFEGTRLRSFDLSPEEAYTLYLATRLLVKQHDKRNEPAETALMKLAQVLTSDAKIGDEIAQAARELAARPAASGYQSIFRTLVRGYIYRKVVRVRYRPLKGKAFDTQFCTYLMEPSAIGFATYAIGHSSAPGAMRWYKVERIQSAELTGESYSIPEDFPGLDILRNAWSIISGEETVPVVLRFSPEVRERVLETQWHPSQDWDEDKEKPGWLRWWVDVADTMDMLPWIRGWGADCEVVGPVWLQKRLEKEARKLAALYGVTEGRTKDSLIAHIRHDGQEQLLITHLTEASRLAEGFAAKVGLPEIGKIMGLLHDFGKASKEFQDYLRSAEGQINPDEDDYVDYKAKKGKIDHSTAGAQLIYEKLANRGQEGKILAQFLALAIASHHSGLIDCLKPDGTNDFMRRMEKVDSDTHLSEARGKLADIEKHLDEILAQPIEKRFYQVVFETMNEPSDSKATRWFKRGLLARFLLSCLLEADRLNTADFENPGNEAVRNYGKYIPWEFLVERLETKLAQFAQETAEMQPGRALEVNQIRAQVAQACLEAAAKPKGIYQLTVPTGGAKTLSSLRFALHHARTHGMERVFYIVPYITIIDQNADTVRNILEKANERGKVVLEHHSNFVPEDDNLEDDTRRRYSLLAENWDAPIVFTTQVQFLEALFGSGTRDARRMHQIANSVIILDEVQTIPIRMTHMFTTVLRFLTHDCGATVVLCTATQPPFDNLDSPYRKLNITNEQHIIQDEPELFQQLTRVEVHDERKPDGWTHEELTDLAERALAEKGSVLIVVNTRASAQALYKKIKDRNLDAEIYHLSTNMCPAHRVDVLEQKIKPKLKAKKPVICVSTQLIEAGVDIDFGAVIRALAGLDSIAQSAGRCNRHGDREDGLGSVWVVNPKDERLTGLPDIEIGRSNAGTIFNFYKKNPASYDDDVLGLKAIDKYYEYYFKRRKAEFDYPVGQKEKMDHDDNLFNLLADNPNVHKGQVDTISLKQSFKTASRIFCVIDSQTNGVIVPYGEGRGIITALCGDVDFHQKRELLKRAQRYSVQLFGWQFQPLQEKGAIHSIQADEIFYLVPHHYDEEIGWSDVPTSNQELLCF